MIIGTAGHVDHGKTSLVKALTGIDTDRLKEEKERGITTELGFAHLALPDGTVASVVDVPGHERFVRAMAAGAGGVDLAVLVVAADEGVMPQTREHLDICALLGVRGGVVAVTKADLLGDLGEGWLDLLKVELAALCEGTFLEGAAVVPCSSRTGEGLEALKAAMVDAGKALEKRPAEGPLFMPVDRAFTMKGFGTVVTGTVYSGQLAVDEAAALLPGPGPLRVRGLQVHGQAVGRVSAGQRAAVNLAGIEATAVRRGMVLARFEELAATRMLDVELGLLPAASAPLGRRSKLLLHLGTAQVEATVVLLDAAQLGPGDKGLAQLRLAEPLAALPGQRFILRGSQALPGRGATLAGGRVLSVASSRRRKGASAVVAPLLDADVQGRVEWALDQAGYAGLTAPELFARVGAGPKQLARALELLCTRGKTLLLDKERRLYLSAKVFSGMAERALAALETFHQREPLKEGLGKEELRQRLGIANERAFGRLVSALVEGGKVEGAADALRLRGRARALSSGDEGLKAKVLEEIAAQGLGPPTLGELATRHRASAARLVELLAVATRDGAVVKVADDLYFDGGALAGLRQRLVDHLRDKKEITTQQFKELVGQSRKYVIPLSEYFDREKVTLRVGEKRMLRRG